MKKPAETPSGITKQYNRQLTRLDTDELVTGDILAIATENGKALEFLVITTSEQEFPGQNLGHDFHIIVKCTEGHSIYVGETGFITSKIISTEGDELRVKFINAPIKLKRIVITRTDNNFGEVGKNPKPDDFDETPPTVVY